MPGSVKKPSAGGGGAEGMEVALDPQQIEEIGMDAATTAKYEQEMIEKQLQQEGEDYSDMVAEHAARQKVRTYVYLASTVLLRMLLWLSWLIKYVFVRMYIACATM